jgi:hypothetical protein
MALIKTKIPESAFVDVRKRIAEILADELPSQAALNKEEWINAKVFSERESAIDKSEPSVINVNLSRGDYGLITAISQDGQYSFNIDIYTRAKSSIDKRGDLKSSERLHRLSGICHHIFSNPVYRTLGFAPPFIMGSSVSTIQFAEPIKEDQASNVFMSRIVLGVRVSENSVIGEGKLIEGYKTTVKMSETDYGYVYEKEPEAE